MPLEIARIITAGHELVGLMLYTGDCSLFFDDIPYVAISVVVRIAASERGYGGSFVNKYSEIQALVLYPFSSIYVRSCVSGNSFQRVFTYPLVGNMPTTLKGKRRVQFLNF